MSDDAYKTLQAPDPIQTHKWNDMNVLELQDQRLILSDRMNMVERMSAGGANQTMLMLVSTIQTALSQIDLLIEEKQKPHDRKNKIQ